jgi:DNA-binding transcriptional LysR family regulator
MNERPDFSALNAFLAVATHRSFRKASDELRVSPSTLSHAMRTLEGRMGVRLLHRTTRSVAPTEAGEALLERIRPLLRDLDAALGDVDSFRSGGPRGKVRINALPVGARLLMQRAVPAFLTRHPEVAVDLVTEGRFVDIVAEGFDAGVRLAESVPEDMIAVPFGGGARFVAVAAPAYLKKHGAPRSPGELSRHSCIRYRLRSGRIYRWEFERRGKSVSVDVPGRITLDDDDLMMEAAAKGFGIAFVPEHAAAAALKANEVEQVLEPWCPVIPGLRLYYPGHRHVPAALRAFVELLKETERAPNQSAIQRRYTV